MTVMRALDKLAEASLKCHLLIANCHLLIATPAHWRKVAASFSKTDADNAQEKECHHQPAATDRPSADGWRSCRLAEDLEKFT